MEANQELIQQAINNILNNEEATQHLVDALFDNKYFQEKLDKYIASKLVIRRDYNAWEGTYDDMTFNFGEHYIEVEEKSYGY